MFKVETAKKIHVVYKNPIEKEVVSNACGCSGVDGVYINAEGDKKPSGFDLTRGKGFGGLLADASKANDASNPYAGSGATSTGVSPNDKKLWANIKKGFETIKNSQGREIAENALIELIAKQRAKGGYVPPEMEAYVPDEKKKITTLGWVGIGVGALALIGLVVYVVKKNN